MTLVLGEARRRLLEELLSEVDAQPRMRVALVGRDADTMASAVMAERIDAHEIVAGREPHSVRRAFDATFPKTPSGLLVVRDCSRADAESRMFLAELATIEGPAIVLVSDRTRTTPPGYRVVAVPDLDEAAVREWLGRPEIVQAVLTASGGANVGLERWLRRLPTPDAMIRRALFGIALADGLTPSDVAALFDVSLDDAEWAALGVRRMGDELRTKQEQVEVDLDADLLRRRLASHFWATRRWSRAIELWLVSDPEEAAERVGRAARFLIDADAPREAVALLEAVDAVVPDDDRGRRIVDLLIEIGAWDQALAAGRRLYRRAPTPDAMFQLATILVETGNALEAGALLKHDTSTATRALRAEVAYHRGELDEAETLAHEVLAEERGLARLDALQTLAKAAVEEPTASIERYDAYLSEAERLESARHRALAMGGRGVAQIRARQLHAAASTLRRAAELAEVANDVKARALAWHNLAVVAHLQHDYQEARRCYEEALRWLRALAHRTSQARCAFNLGELYATLGAFERALAMADLGAHVGQNLPPAAAAEGALLRGRALLALERWSLAEVALEDARSHEAVLVPSRRVAIEIALAQVEMADGRAEAALDRLDTIDGTTLPHGRRAELWLARAVATKRLLRFDREHALVMRALQHAQEADDPHLELEALVMLANAGDADAESHRRRARLIEEDLAERVPDDLLQAWNARPTRRALDRDPSTGDRAIVGTSRQIADVLAQVERIAPTRCTVLLRGESGTGKELIAEAIHRGSERRHGPLVRVSCAALVDTLLASELFGHEKGAFTGATEQRQGRFEIADGGTLFLDEVGELSPRVQAALLRVLQERSFERVGGRETIQVDVRVIAATHRDLEAMVADGRFREDLYYRLNEVELELPPLRDRPEDIEPLAHHVLARIASEGLPARRLSADAAALLRAHDWPGNVRQLENAVRAAALFASGPVLGPDDFKLPGRSTPSEPDDAWARLRRGDLSLRDLKKEIERSLIVKALGESGGNVTRAAAMLGMTRPRLSQLVKEYGLRGGRATEGSPQ